VKFGLKIRAYGHRVGIVRSRTKVTELVGLNKLKERSYVCGVQGGGEYIK
jgi:hypothetical protein